MQLFLFVMTLGIGTILYAATRMKGETASDKELEQTIQAFMDELEEENETLLQTIKEMKEELSRESDLNRNRIESLEVQFNQMIRQIDGQTTSEMEVSSALIFNEYYSRVVAMDREGRSPEQISKETGIGIGEIQVVLNLVRQGNEV